MATGSITISNTGTGPLNVTVPSPKDPPFTETNGGSFSIGGGGQRIVTITYAPTKKGSSSSTITITSDDPTHKKGEKVKIKGKAK